MRFANYSYYHANGLGATNLVLFKSACDGDLRIDKVSVGGEKLSMLRNKFTGRREEASIDLHPSDLLFGSML